MKFPLMLMAVACLSHHMYSQDNVVMGFGNHGVKSDSIRSVQQWLKSSDWHFHSRSFFMSTINEGRLKDDYALAQGAGIGLLTKSFKGFQLGLSGYFIFNLWSSDLSARDEQTQGLNRYEIGQFDVLNRSNRSSFDRLEELFLSHSGRQGKVTIGRFSVETPFVNMQDGRMRPTLEEGLWVESAPKKAWKLQAGVINRIFPRSTTQWMNLNESVGIYGLGVNSLSGKSQLKIDGAARKLFMLNADCKLGHSTLLRYWNVAFERVMNTQMIEFRQTQNMLGGEGAFNLMWIQQNALADGGNKELLLTYFQPGSQSNVFSTQLTWKKKKSHYNISYTHILDGDRYLMPREWGRDPFYTFMPRERNEGLANVHAFTAQCSKGLPSGLKLGLGLGYYRLPSIFNVEQNKYGMPSYGQVNTSASYSFHGIWEGLEIRLLIAGKTNMDAENVPLKNQINKVNMINSNLIVDFRL